MLMIKQATIFVLVLSLSGGGCVSNTLTTLKTASENSATERIWTEIAPDIRRYECSHTVCGERLIIYRFTKDLFNWRFENRVTPSTVEYWAKTLPNAIFVANGVFFDENEQPTGLLKTTNKLVNTKMYEADKSGLLELAPMVDVVDTSATKIDIANMTEAAQSFPLLIKNGAAVASFKDTRGARRTFIGTDKNDDVYIGIIPEDAITFADLAKLLVTTGVKWNNVLNLDGGTSTGIAARIGDYNETMNSIVQIPNVIVVEKIK